MTIHLNNTRYRIVFQYGRPGFDGPTITYCLVFDDARKLIAEGVAKRNPADRHNKETARRLALDRALHACPEFNRAMRRAVWQVYEERKEGARVQTALPD